MHNKKIMLYATVIMLISAISLTGQAAYNKQGDEPVNDNKAKKTAKVEPKVPIVIEADNLSFNDATGDLFAMGNVSVVQNGEKLLAESMRGNSKQTEFWIDDKANFFQPGTKLTGMETHYNFSQHIGSMQDVKGNVGRQLVVGKSIEMFPGEMVIHNGTATKCSAKVPDYHISADKIEIWPNEKMIAYNAKFWIKDKVIYSRAKYQTSLVKGEEKSAFPEFGYNSSDGIIVSQYLEEPITDSVVAFADLALYSKRGLEPRYGLISRQSHYTVSLYNSSEANGDNEWIKKEPEVSFQLKPIKSGRVITNFSASIGNWKQGNVTGNREDYSIYFSREPIKISPNVDWNIGTGWENIHYGYNNSSNRIWRFNTTVNAKVNERLETWVGYSYNNQSGTSVYQYDKIDTAREFSSGFKYKVDSKNALGVNMYYDLSLGKIKDVDYTWYRDLHCWEANLTYRAKRQQWQYAIKAINW